MFEGGGILSAKKIATSATSTDVERNMLNRLSTYIKTRLAGVATKGDIEKIANLDGNSSDLSPLDLMTLELSETSAARPYEIDKMFHPRLEVDR